MIRIALSMLTLGLSLAPVLSWAAEPNADQAKAIAAIEKLGGKVTIDEKRAGKPVVAVDWAGSKVTNAGLTYLKGLPQIQSLDLGRTQVTNVGLENLKD